MKRLWLLVLILLCALPTWAQQADEKVTVPTSLLTQDQLAELRRKNLGDKVVGWAGVGKEIGEAVNSSLQAVTVQSNNFAQTGVGKLTVVLVIWKVIGSEFVHIVTGLLELLIFIPLWIWSYRRTCITRAIKLPDKTVKIVEYSKQGYEEFTPRMVHMFLMIGIAVMFLSTTFSY
jgi:hypothetical protein